MDYHAGPEYDYSDVVETLSNMFGDILSKDVIVSVVESCGGDLNLAADSIMNISNDTTTVETHSKMDQNTEQNPITTNSNPVVTENTPTDTHPGEDTPVSNSDNASPTSQPGISYASASKSTGAVPKQVQLRPHKPKVKESFCTEQFQRIVAYHNQGSKVLVLMRGLPGSGKSYLAKKIVEATIGTSFVDYKTHICSTDDYFMVRGVYIYERQRLSEAHEWNQFRVTAVLQQGLSPVIVDNTNIEIWEMEPYLRNGVKNGYFIEVMEPNTSWAKKFNQLIKRNSHNVPAVSIKRMLNNFQDGLTGDFLIKHYGLSYPTNMVPPVIRTVPAYYPPHVEVSAHNLDTNSVNIAHQYTVDNIEMTLQTKCTMEHNPSPNARTECTEQTTVTEKMIAGLKNDSASSLITDATNKENDVETEAKLNKVFEIKKQLEEFEEVEQAWENGEAWDETKSNTRVSVNSSENATCVDPKPPRSCHNSEGSTPRDTLLETAVLSCNDWRQMYMPPWNNDDSLQEVEIPKVIVKTKSTGTSIDIGDSNLKDSPKMFKIITAIPRDINLFYISPNKEKIPNKRALHKSTMTSNDDIINNTHKCNNEEKHFSAFRKMFKSVSKVALRDIFDKCCGDVNWAVDIVLGGIADNQLQFMDNDDEEISDNEDENSEQCPCVAAYNVIPDAGYSAKAIDKGEQNIPEITRHAVIVPTKRMKVVPSESSAAAAAELKRQIEMNVVISDSHYSEHLLKIRKYQRGETAENTIEKDIPSQTSENAMAVTLDNQNIDNQCSTSKTEVANCRSDDDVSSCSSLDELERTVNVNFGNEFLLQLDNLFGRTGMTYPENVLPKINIPMSLLQEINAFWLESLMYQLDEHDKQDAKMILEDEEFARQLANKEAELARLGKEPDVPDFKEIMDVDFALSLYHKDVAEWKSKAPNDWAAKLTRDKLYNLFPEMSHEILSELLMAHDNNFKLTVEVLLMSTGRADILETENGLNKFVMQKEIERQEKLLEEENKTLSEEEWPLLPRGEKVAMSTVNEYREEANRHLNIRNINYQKAQDFIRRGMTQVANYFNDVAKFHKKKFEQANSMAAATLMRIHAENCRDNATIDLHYLRVSEAKESLDLFLDTHIQKLRESNNRGPRFHTLFFITGRGLHSSGGPRVKPAVKKRLQERGLIVSERNPGLLTARVCAHNKLSYQVQVP